jgi:glucose/arabinose dehydrogenase
MLKYINTLLIIAFVLIFLFSFIKINHYTKPDNFNKLLTDTITTPEFNYQNFCGGCHGEKMDAFVDRNWKHGSSREDLFKGIKTGYHNEGMPAFDSAFNDQQIYELADYIITGIKNVSRYIGNERPTSNIFKTENLTIRLDTVMKGLNVPWGMVFLPQDEMLITDRNGKIYYRKKDGSVILVEGGPQVVNAGQGGLMDIVLDPDFRKNKFIYFSYSKENKEDRRLATTAIMKAKFDNGGLSDQKDIFIAQPYSTTRHHYGSRMQFDKDGFLYFSVGERGNEKQNPQQINGNDLGKIHRIKSDGTIPGDNPFVKVAGASPSIYSYGHRNPQGLCMDPTTGKIWVNEHGPRGGDEINIVEPTKNYGWPDITYGINYNGRPMAPGTKTSMPGMEQPFHQWTPSIGPSGMAFVTSKKYKDWKGNIMSGSLRFKYLNRTVVKDGKVIKEEILFKNIGRVRDVRMGPDDYIYIAVETPGIIYRLTPVR